jgi:hypothetical protein
MGARKNYTSQINNVINAGLKKVGERPCIIGECGIPMDINQKRAFISGDYRHHTNFLDAVLSSLDVRQVNVGQFGRIHTLELQSFEHLGDG